MQIENFIKIVKIVELFRWVLKNRGKILQQ